VSGEDDPFEALLREALSPDRDGDRQRFSRRVTARIAADRLLAAQRARLWRTLVRDLLGLLAIAASLIAFASLNSGSPALVTTTVLLLALWLVTTLPAPLGNRAGSVTKLNLR
jgi:hypothetical protein